MRNLIYLIVRYSAFILFVLFEILAFVLIVNYNKSQKEIWSHSSNLLTGSIYKRLENVEDYFDLRSQNDSLVQANAKLIETIINYRIESKDNAFQEFENTDSLRNYQIIPVRICSKTLNLRNNYFTLCKGSTSGIEIGMGVISDNGIVGIVKAVSSEFATVQLIINSQSRISAKVSSNNYPGTLVWNNSDPRVLNLEEVPKHASIQIGDSISTSGYSVSFPPDVLIGTIQDFSAAKAGNNYTINVDLNNDLAALEFVYVVKFSYLEEKEDLINEENE